MKGDGRAIIGLLMDRPVAYHPDLARILGSVKCAVFACQMLYWTGKERRADGFIWKTQAEIEEETALTRYEQQTARKKLVKLGVMEERLMGIPARLHYRMNLDTLQTMVQDFYKQDWGNPTNKDGGSLQTITENTSESTEDHVPSYGGEAAPPPPPTPPPLQAKNEKSLPNSQSEQALRSGLAGSAGAAGCAEFPPDGFQAPAAGSAGTLASKPETSPDDQPPPGGSAGALASKPKASPDDQPPPGGSAGTPASKPETSPDDQPPPGGSAGALASKPETSPDDQPPPASSAGAVASKPETSPDDQPPSAGSAGALADSGAAPSGDSNALPEVQQTAPAWARQYDGPDEVIKIPTQHQQLFAKLAQVCGIDLVLATDSQRNQLGVSVKKLKRAKVTVDDLAAFSDWWRQHDWRGQKGDHPQPHQVREEWRRFKEHQAKAGRSLREAQLAAGAVAIYT